MLRKIKLYGELAKFLGQKTFEAEVHSAAQAMRFLVVNFPQLERHMADRYYKVNVGNWELTQEELVYPNGQEDIKIVPVVGGSGGNFGKILMGAALIGAAFFVPNGLVFSEGISTGFGFASAGKLAKGLVYLGASLALQGVSEMLFPMPKPKEFKSEQDPQLSFSFSGTQNTSRAGTPVPIVYGEIVTGSVVISGAIDTQQVQA